MRSQAKPRPQRLILAGIVALAILLLLLRLFVFAHGHGRHRFRGAVSGPADAVGTIRAASLSRSANQPALHWTDRFADGTPDFLRLTDPADQAAFRQWFTAIADYQAIRPRADLPPERVQVQIFARGAARPEEE